MGYPNFGKVKTIVLPSPDDFMSLEDYKKTYGIDLKDFIVLENGEISIKSEILNSSLILIRQAENVGPITPLCPVVEVVGQSDYEEGVRGSDTRLCTFYNKDETGYYGLFLSVGKDSPFDIEHVKIGTVDF